MERSMSWMESGRRRLLKLDVWRISRTVETSVARLDRDVVVVDGDGGGGGRIWCLGASKTKVEDGNKIGTWSWVLRMTSLLDK